MKFKLKVCLLTCIFLIFFGSYSNISYADKYSDCKNLNFEVSLSTTISCKETQDGVQLQVPQASIQGGETIGRVYYKDGLDIESDFDGEFDIFLGNKYNGTGDAGLTFFVTGDQKRDFHISGGGSLGAYGYNEFPSRGLLVNPNYRSNIQLFYYEDNIISADNVIMININGVDRSQYQALQNAVVLEFDLFRNKEYKEVDVKFADYFPNGERKPVLSKEAAGRYLYSPGPLLGDVPLPQYELKKKNGVGPAPNDYNTPKDVNNHIAVTIPKILYGMSEVDKIDDTSSLILDHYQLAEFSCRSMSDPSCLSNGQWRTVSFNWNARTETMQYTISSERNSDLDFCFSFNQEQCLDAKGEYKDNPQELRDKSAEEYFFKGSQQEDNKIYWGFTGVSRGSEHRIRMKRYPEQNVEPLPINLQLKEGGQRLSSSEGFRSTLEYKDNNDWKKLCENLEFDNGIISIDEKTNKECWEEVKKHSRFEFRFVLTDTPPYYPKEGYYIPGENDNPIYSEEAKITSSDKDKESIEFTINTKENKWGTCAWDLGSSNILSLSKDKIDYCELGSGTDNEEVVSGIPKEKVKTVDFKNTIELPSGGSQFFNMFTKVEQYKNIDKLKSDNANDLSRMFNENRALTSLNLTHFNTENVTDMSYMFSGDTKLTKIALGENFNTKNVKNMSHMFNENQSLESLDLTHFNTENVTDMSYMFNKNESLKILDLRTFSTNDTKMKNMLQDTNIQQLGLGENFAFATDANLPNITNMIGYDQEKYTGRWVKKNPYKVFESSEVLMRDYEGHLDYGLYEWQKKISLDVPEEIIFLGKVDYNKEQWLGPITNHPEQDLNIKASNYQDSWSVTMKVIGEESDDIFKDQLCYLQDEYNCKFFGEDGIVIINSDEKDPNNDTIEKNLSIKLRIDPMQSLSPKRNEDSYEAYQGKLLFVLSSTP